jgi:hypothetical protein
MKSTKVRSDSREPQKLEVRYGEIGISAVAAAMQCRGVSKAAPAEKQSGEKAKEREFA